jgi:hypothetical protein
MNKPRAILLCIIGFGLLMGVMWFNLRINIVTNREVGIEIKRQLDSSGTWMKTDHDRFARDVRDDVEDMRARIRRLEATTRPAR